MKRILIAAMAFCATLTFSCKKDNTTHDLFIGATMQNTDWTAQPTTTYFAGKDSLQIEGSHANTNDQQNLVIKIPFHGKGNYLITGDQANYFTILGGDAVTSTYTLDPTQNNYVNITSFNAVTNIATGNFELHFLKFYGPETLVTTLNFTNGQFWIETPPVN
jgi:hypothetical protein